MRPPGPASAGTVVEQLACRVSQRGLVGGEVEIHRRRTLLRNPKIRRETQVGCEGTTTNARSCRDRETPAYFRHGDTEIELPVVRGTENELGGRHLEAAVVQTGFITLDYGYMNTGATESAITYIDGDEGILRYRGIPIEQLVERESPSFLETSYLLIYGQLPSHAELDEFRFGIRRHTLLHEDVKSFFDGFPKDAHPMAVLSSVVSALSTFYQDSDDPHDSRAGAALDPAAHGQDPDDRGLRVQEVDRPAVPLPGQPARPHRELPHDDVRGAVGAVRRRRRRSCTR